VSGNCLGINTINTGSLPSLENSKAKILREVDTRYCRYTSTAWFRSHLNKHAEGYQEVFCTHKENQKQLEGGIFSVSSLTACLVCLSKLRKIGLLDGNVRPLMD
jgi:hypothetical protein